MSIKKFFNLKKPPDDDVVIIDNGKHQTSFQDRENENYSDQNTDIDLTIEPTGKKARDLMKLVGKAIDYWAEMYDLDRLPKHIVFGQALSIMNAWNELRVSNDKL